MLAKASFIPFCSVGKHAGAEAPTRPTQSKFSVPIFQARQATLQSACRNTLIEALAYSAAVRAARRRARARSITGPSFSRWNASQPMQRLA